MKVGGGPFQRGIPNPPPAPCRWETASRPPDVNPEFASGNVNPEVTEARDLVSQKVLMKSF